MSLQSRPSKAEIQSRLEAFLGGEEAANRRSSQTYQVGGDHYLNMGIQPWDAMRAWMSPEEFQGFLRGNVIKYVARCEAKGGVQDLRKARHYLDTLIDEVERTASSATSPNPNPQE